ncbi:glycosyltransferase 6 family protein [Francisella philomiragia subsp. philomiragia ATCC 25015]|uniref:family 6 glucosyltransferase n=1 Tax=Francisella philomiragia TaxID=28110 RepID=UPI0001AF79BE|nr:family 6 glucosyltransferase [Francisella philomiragia]AJI74716.1 glycosyltransferase 6 family protein [Francisella philomiragia subsp. philomiragia ATCC 25015]EET21242.1 predicted protein [Francisella philomiragia subsp. philomiragia ATCC 25015]MBK2238894.1 glycosyl transferase family 6 [Francisella philomiragia]
MSNKKLIVLYIATGEYIKFWKDFYLSAEKFFLKNSNISLEYIVYTDSTCIFAEEKENVLRIYQENMEWPYITLFRFKIFKKALPYLYNSDYIFFFNSNMKFISDVNEKILPQGSKQLTFVMHPGYYNKPVKKFTYEKNNNSLAFVPKSLGKYYFMGGVNGGTTKAYIKLINDLEYAIDQDLKKNVIAIWHDESHLNKYAITHEKLIHVLSPQYGYPEGLSNPDFEIKLVIKNKENYIDIHTIKGSKRRNVFLNIYSYIKGLLSENN